MSKRNKHVAVERDYFRGPDTIQRAETSVTEAIKKRRKVQQVVPPAPKKRTHEAGLEHEIYLAQLGIGQYEHMLENGDYIPPDEMRIFLSMLNTLRQLKVSLAGIKAREKEEKMGPIEVAKGLVETGMSKEEVLKLYPGNKKVREALEQLD